MSAQHHHHYSLPRTISEIVVCNAKCDQKHGPRLVIRRDSNADLYDSISAPCTDSQCPGSLFDDDPEDTT